MNEYDKARIDAGCASTPGRVVGSGAAIGQMRDQMNGCASESPRSLRSRAESKAHNAAAESIRYEQLAQKLTPEIETMLVCLQECIALGLIDLRFLTEAFEKTRARY